MERPVTHATVEEAYRRAIAWQRNGHVRFAEKGLRIARSEGQASTKLLRTLERASEVLSKAADYQTGETRRAGVYGNRPVPMEVSLFREAFVSMDKKQPEPAFQWIYAAGAWLAGLNEE